jgi:hypothetical protein
MKKILSCFLLTTFSVAAFSQTSKILDKAATAQLLEEMGPTDLPIFRAYEYQDNYGVYELLLCEDQKLVKGADTFSSKIEASCYLNDHGGLLEQWKIADFIEPGKDITNGEAESDIHFWTKYCSVTDIDKDKIIDPVIVYGTKNEYGVRRIKIITLYKGKKYVIRAVECDLDYCRSFKKDESFKSLPLQIRQYIDALLERMRKEQGVILKNG